MLFVVLVVAFSVYPAVLAETGAPVPLPPDLDIVKPALDVPGAVFSGIWDGVWQSSNNRYNVPKDVVIVIERIDGERVTIVYALRERGEESYVRVERKLSSVNKIDFDLGNGIKRVQLIYKGSSKKIYGTYFRGNITDEAIFSPRPQKAKLGKWNSKKEQIVSDFLALPFLCSFQTVIVNFRNDLFRRGEIFKKSRHQ